MNVFTYGSLMFPEVWTRVVRGDYHQAPATAHGYRRSAVKDETYPGIVAATDERVDGVVYFDVDAGDVAELDTFEGVDYRRIEIALALRDGSRVDAQTYLFLSEEKLAASPWDPKNFALEIFLRSCCNFHQPRQRNSGRRT